MSEKTAINNALLGGALGGVAGAAIGGASAEKGHRLRGALLGGLGGGALGATAGHVGGGQLSSEVARHNAATTGVRRAARDAAGRASERVLTEAKQLQEATQRQRPGAAVLAHDPVQHAADASRMFHDHAMLAGSEASHQLVPVHARRMAQIGAGTGAAALGGGALAGLGAGAIPSEKRAEVMKYIAFTIELEKVANVSKSRSGSRSIRASTLLAKEHLDKTNGTLKTKTASGEDLIKKIAPKAALVAAGALGYDQAQKAYNDWQLGRSLRLNQQR